MNILEIKDVDIIKLRELTIDQKGNIFKKWLNEDSLMSPVQCHCKLNTSCNISCASFAVIKHNNHHIANCTSMGEIGLLINKVVK